MNVGHEPYNRHLVYRFVASTKSIDYSRTVYSVLDAFSDIGGLVDALKATVSLILLSYSENFFKSDIVNKAFRVIRKSDHLNVKREIVQKIQHKSALQDDILTQLTQTLPSKSRLKLSYFQSLLSYNSFLQKKLCRSCVSSKTFKEYRYLNQGCDRIDKTLDLMKLIRDQQTLKILVHTLFDSQQRKLIRNHACRDLYDDGSQMESESSVEQSIDFRQIKYSFRNELLDMPIRKQIDKKLIIGLLEKDLNYKAKTIQQRDQTNQSMNFNNSHLLTNAPVMPTIQVSSLLSDTVQVKASKNKLIRNNQSAPNQY